MSRGRVLFLLLLAATIAVYLVVVLWSLPLISDAANGLTPFDLRPFGYDPVQARAFLGALSDAGRAQYLGPQRWLDMAYPALMAATLVIAVRHLLPTGWRAARGGIAGLVLGGAVFDYLENARVRAMLLADPAGVSDAMIHAASFATALKSALTALALVALISALIWRVATRKRTQ